MPAPPKPPGPQPRTRQPPRTRSRKHRPPPPRRPLSIGWGGVANWHDSSLPIAAVLRSWEERFGARLLEVGFAQIRLVVERPPATLDQARRVAAEQYAFCDECGDGLADVPRIAAGLVGAPLWSFWWD